MCVDVCMCISLRSVPPNPQPAKARFRFHLPCFPPLFLFLFSSLLVMIFVSSSLPHIFALKFLCFYIAICCCCWLLLFLNRTQLPCAIDRQPIHVGLCVELSFFSTSLISWLLLLGEQLCLDNFFFGRGGNVVATLMRIFSLAINK